MSNKTVETDQPGVGLRPLVMRPVPTGDVDRDALGRRRLAGMLDELAAVRALLGPNATNDLYTRLIWIEEAIEAALKQAAQDTEDA